MNEYSKNGFYSPTKGSLSLVEVLQDISLFVSEDADSQYRLVIGTDSKTRRVGGEQEVDFVTAIVVHRQGWGGRYFWTKDKQKKTFFLRDRIYTEVWRSLNLAQELVPQLMGVVPEDRYDLEIHIDVGTKGPTREMIKEVVGMVVGNGFTPKTKPQSYAASTVADKHT